MSGLKPGPTRCRSSHTDSNVLGYSQPSLRDLVFDRSSHTDAKALSVYTGMCSRTARLGRGGGGWTEPDQHLPGLFGTRRILRPWLRFLLRPRLRLGSCFGLWPCFRSRPLLRSGSFLGSWPFLGSGPFLGYRVCLL